MSDQLAIRLKELRTDSGYSQEYVAEQIGVSRQAVSKWEKGSSSPSTANLMELADLYKVSIDMLVNSEEKADSKEEKAKKFCRILKGIALVTLAIYILHFIVWSGVYLVYTYAGGTASGIAEKIAMPVSILGLIIMAIGYVTGRLSSLAVFIIGCINKNIKDALFGIILLLLHIFVLFAIAIADINMSI